MPKSRFADKQKARTDDILTKGPFIIFKVLKFRFSFEIVGGWVKAKIENRNSLFVTKGWKLKKI